MNLLEFIESGAVPFLMANETVPVPSRKIAECTQQGLLGVHLPDVCIHAMKRNFRWLSTLGTTVVVPPWIFADTNADGPFLVEWLDFQAHVSRLHVLHRS